MKSVNKSKAEGFTIIEVVLVLAIAALIFLLVFLALPALQRNQRDTQRRSDLGRMMSQIQSYQSSNNGNVPTSSAALTTFKTGYLTVGSEGFRDPRGNDYNTVYGIPSASSPVINEGTAEQIYFSSAAKCNGETMVAVAGSPRSAAARLDLEGGGWYCLDNQ